jgi:predicted O-methyltransferase YrrM
MNPLVRRTLNRLKDAVGLPVDFSHDEFLRAKQSLDWSAIDARRIQTLASVFNRPQDEIRAYVEEAEAIDVAEKVDGEEEGWSEVGNPMGRTDRLTLYATVRAFVPRLAIETGTGAGASSVYILAAMHRNGEGRLISIDASPHRDNVGRLVPDSLRDRMELLKGSSLEALPGLDLRDFDFFLHDSDHAYRNMMAEYEFAFRHFRDRGALCSHDVLMTNAWKHIVRRHGIKRSTVIKNFGVLAWTREG